jgi:PAS domain S-box-containing protein
VDQIEEQFANPGPDSEPGMNLISVDFDIIMVNRTNERLYAKPMVAMLGSKCYLEFEKRDEPCPHCPGRLALETGEAKEAETTGLRDDGTRFAARIKAHPVIGPDNRPTGFIEIVEDITEQKRAESLASIDSQLQTWLAGIQNISSALREALRATLLVEGIDCGAAFILDGGEDRLDLVQERGLAPASVETFAEIARQASSPGAAGSHVFEPPERARVAGSPRVVAVVPILNRGSTLAVLVVGSTVYPVMPASLRTGLQVLGTTTGTAISRIRAEQSRGDAIADLEAVITVSPLATWVVDGRGCITMWNRAAEKVFGWRAGEVVGSAPPWGPSPTASGSREAVLGRKDGRPVEVRVSSARFRDVVGNDSAHIFIAEDLRTERRLLELQTRVAELEARCALETAAGTIQETRDGSLEDVRVFIVDGDETWGEELAEVLGSLGCTPVRCAAPEHTAEMLARAGAAEQPFCVAVVALVGPGGASGLGQRAALRSLGLDAPVILSSDVEVRGHEQHGIAAVIRRPYEQEAVREALMVALREGRAC